MELEFKHIAAYLPYELKAELLDYKSDYVNSQYDEVVGLHQWDKSGKLWSVLTLGGAKPSIKRVKPILRPWSDFTKEIEVNGEKFVPYYWFDENKYVRYASLGFNSIKFKINDYYTICICNRLPAIKFDLKEENEILKTLPLNIIEKLLEWHFDIYGLIEAGLAVDINTIEP